jgi:hypothetical protein
LKVSDYVDSEEELAVDDTAQTPNIKEELLENLEVPS